MIRFIPFVCAGLCWTSAAFAIAPIGPPDPRALIYICTLAEDLDDKVLALNMGVDNGKINVTTSSAPLDARMGRSVRIHNPHSDIVTSTVMRTRGDFDFIGRGTYQIVVAPNGSGRVNLAHYDANLGATFLTFVVACEKGEAY